MPSDVYVSMFNNSNAATTYFNLGEKYHQLTGAIGHIDFRGKGTIDNNDPDRVYITEVAIWGDDDPLTTINWPIVIPRLNSMFPLPE